MPVRSARIHHIVFWAIAACFVIFRIIIAVKTPVWINPEELADDILMLNYADIFNHFTNWNTISMAKTMSFPFLLGISHVLGLPYPLAVCFLWFAGALLTLWFFSHYVKAGYGRLIIFLFVLYCPVAFDIWTGLRIYRQAVIAPTALIAIMCIFLLVIKLYLYCSGDDKSAFAIHKILLTGLLSGISFFYFYYVKEDGFWLVPLLAIATAAGLFFALKNKFTRDLKIKLVIFALTPLIFFFAGTNIYKAVNYKYFGVFEITTRTGGEFGQFVSNLINIEDENKTREIWIPYSTLEKAWNVSPSLASVPELLASLGTQEEDPLPGDLVFWAMKGKLDELGLHESEQQAEQFFKEVNGELEAAFRDGRLKKTAGISISSNVPTRSPAEIMDLLPLIQEMFKDQALWDWAYSDIHYKDHERMAVVESVLHITLHRDWGDMSDTDYAFLSISNVIIAIYRFFAPVLILSALAGFVLWFIKSLRRRKGGTVSQLPCPAPILAVATILSCLILFAGVAWFIEWLYLGLADSPYAARTIINYYSCGAAPLFLILEIFGISYLFRQIFSVSLKTKQRFPRLYNA